MGGTYAYLFSLKLNISGPQPWDTDYSDVLGAGSKFEIQMVHSGVFLSGGGYGPLFANLAVETLT